MSASRNSFWPEEHEGFQHYITYDRDGLGRGTGVNFDGDGQNIPAGGLDLVSGAEFYPSGTLSGFDYGNGQSFMQTLNARLQPEQLLATNGTTTALNLSYLFNARGLITEQTDGVDTTNSRSYLYDGQGRLTEASGPWGNGTFEYDALGNVLSKQLGARHIALTYNGKNRVTQSVDTGETGTRSHGYDDRGNVTSIGGLNMHYDATDRPTGLSGDATGSYRYDGHGRRVKSITVHDDDTKTIRFNVYDASGSLVYVVQLAPGTDDDHITNYIKLDGRTVARVKSVGTRLNYNDEMTYLHHDHLGSAVAGTDENGAVLWTEQYTPFGISLVNFADNDNQAGFTGHLKDTDTGLTYMQARYYDPVIGRFLSHDPEGFMSQDLNPMYFNRFMYTANNPVNATDPNGQETRYNYFLMQQESDRLSGRKSNADILAERTAAGQGALAGATFFLPGPEDLFLAGFVVKKVGRIFGIGKAEVPQITRNAADGKSFQNGVGKHNDLTPNTQNFDTNIQNTVPDFKDGPDVGESKSVKSISNTRQLRSQRDLAESEGGTHTLYLNADKDPQISKPLRESSTRIIMCDANGKPC